MVFKSVAINVIKEQSDNRLTNNSLSLPKKQYLRLEIRLESL